MQQDSQIVCERGQAKLPDMNAVSKVFITGHIIEVETIDKPPKNLNRYRKLNKYQYVDTVSGELLDYKPDKRSKSSSIKPTFDRLRRIINANFTGNPSEVHIVLTYQEFMSDTKQMYLDFKRFWQRFSYRYPNCRYIVVTEPQESGSWHFHLLVKSTDKSFFFVPHSKLTDLWGHGFTWIRNLAGVDNIGLYFVARLKDVDSNEDLQDENRSKSIKKGARLDFYPPNMKIYRCSSGIIRPQPIVVPYQSVGEIVDKHEPCFSRTIRIIRRDADGDKELNAITYEHYNLHR